MGVGAVVGSDGWERGSQHFDLATAPDFNPSKQLAHLPHRTALLQVTSLTLITATGTALTVTPTSNPHLFHALGVSVGRLGVITELTLRIRPQMAVTKSLQVGGSGWWAGGTVCGEGWWGDSMMPACPRHCPLTSRLSLSLPAPAGAELQAVCAAGQGHAGPLCGGACGGRRGGHEARAG